MFPSRAFFLETPAGQATQARLFARPPLHKPYGISIFTRLILRMFPDNDFAKVLYHWSIHQQLFCLVTHFNAWFVGLVVMCGYRKDFCSRDSHLGNCMWFSCSSPLRNSFLTSRTSTSSCIFIMESSNPWFVYRVQFDGATQLKNCFEFGFKVIPQYCIAHRYTYTMKGISHKLSSIAKKNCSFSFNEHGDLHFYCIIMVYISSS